MKKMEDDITTSRKRKLENQQEEEGEIDDNKQPQNGTLDVFLVFHKLIFILIGRGCATLFSVYFCI